MTLAMARAKETLAAALLVQAAAQGNRALLDQRFEEHSRAILDLVEAAQADGARLAAEAATRLIVAVESVEGLGNA